MMNKLLPMMNWFPISRDDLRVDFIAGITVALILIPQSMAYAQLAGLPSNYGLYAAFLPVVVAALWGSSRQLSTGPVAVVSILSATTLAQYAELGSEQFIGLAIMLSLLIGVFQLLLGLFKLGMIVNFISHPVIVGFTNAAALIIGLSQFNKIFGVAMPRSDNFANDILTMLSNIGNTHWITFAFGLGAVITMLGIKKYLPKIPGALVVVMASIIISYFIDFEQSGGKVVGQIQSGLPAIAFPELDFKILPTLFVSAIIISLIGFMEAISIAKSMAAKTKDKIDANQELIGQGAANIIGSFSQSYPTAGSFSRSAVNLNSGAKTGMSSMFTAILVGVTLLFFTDKLYHLPQAVLAAVIIMAVIGLINFKAIVHAWRANIHDGIASIITFTATLALAPHLEEGIIIGIGLSLILYLYRTMKPRVAVLGRYNDGTMRDIDIHQDLPQDKRVTVVRFDGALYFANVAFFEEAITRVMNTRPEAKYILVVSDAIIELDASGEEAISSLVDDLLVNGVVLVFSGLKRQVLKVMNSTHLFAKIGAENIHPNEDMALEHIYSRLNADENEEISDYCLLSPSKKAAVIKSLN